jgi:hypothetical protein
VATTLAEFCAVVWKAKLGSTLGHLVEEIPKQNVKGTVWLFLAAYTKL